MRQPKKFNPYPFAYHQEIEVEITALSNLGVGIARVKLDDITAELSPEPAKVSLPGMKKRVVKESSSAVKKTAEECTEETPEKDAGWVIFVPHTLPGEKVITRIFRNDKSHSQGDFVKVIQASPDRVDPKCELFGQCGGCQYQHFAYDKQLIWKTRQVEELLQHMAGVETQVSPTIASPKEWGYRSKITPHFKKPRDGKIESIGFLLAGQRSKLVDVSHCAIAMEEINDALPAVREKARANTNLYKRDASLFIRATEGRAETNHKNTISETVKTDNGDVKFNFLAGDFFQNNPFILPAFTGYVADQAASPSNQPDESGEQKSEGAKYLVDAYCGSGLFSLCLAHRFEKVAGVEVSETAAEWASKNAEMNGITNTTFLASSAEAIFSDISFPPAETAVVIDPPRKGCNQEFLDQLFEFGPSKVVYVSCNPATQMRDLREFLTAGYQLTAVQPFDLFPQTRHLECVIVLER